ncbi:MAG TPA: hypothetical protein VFV99_31435 [Kofleriaceae bacterium]|nr:hypothetical protein [Kofleriaceae bacterium]
MKTCAALVVLASLTRLAHADERVVTLDRTCVAIDDADGLAATDREYAVALMQRVLERADLFVVASDCTETYTISHQQVDGRFVIRVRNSAGKRRMTTDAMNELSEKYERMVRSLIQAKEAQELSQAAMPEPATATKVVATAQEAAATPDSAPLPTLQATDETSTSETTDGTEYDGDVKQRMWYGLAGLQLTGGGGVTMGYRHELATTTIDIAGNLRGADTGTAGVALGVELLKYHWSSPTRAVYGGGGLSVGSLDRSDQYGANHYWGSGLQGELTAGAQFGGKTGVRGLIQLDITLPFFQMGNDNGDKEYVAAAMVSGGLGW